MSDFSENEALNGTEDLALPSLGIHPRFHPFSSLTAPQGGSRGTIPLCPPRPVPSGGSCSMPGQCRGPLSPGCASSARRGPSCKAVTAGEQPRAAGPAKPRVRGRFAFVRARRERALAAQRELKNVSMEALGLPGAVQAPFAGWCSAGCPRSRAGCLLSPLFFPGHLPAVRGSVSCGSLPLQALLFSSLSSSLNNRGVEGIYTSAW